MIHLLLFDEICLYAKDLNESKYQILIKKRENAGIKHLNDPNEFREYSNTLNDVFNNIDDYNPKKKWKILIAFGDLIADRNTNRRSLSIVKELFIRCRKLNISLAFITQTYFPVPKDVRLNSKLYLIMKFHNKRGLQQIANNHSADIDY